MTVDYDPNLDHAVWVRHQPGLAAEAPLLLLHLWWGWGTLQHPPSPVDPGGQVFTEAWRPDSTSHVGNTATACPVCIAAIARADAMHDGWDQLLRTPRKSPLHP